MDASLTRNPNGYTAVILAESQQERHQVLDAFGFGFDRDNLIIDDDGSYFLDARFGAASYPEYFGNLALLSEQGNIIRISPIDEESRPSDDALKAKAYEALRNGGAIIHVALTELNWSVFFSRIGY